MCESIKQFLDGILKNVYRKLAVLLCGLPSLLFLPFIKAHLPTKWQGYNNMTILLIVVIIFLIFILLASFETYHKLRMKSIADVYEFIPEAKKGKVFRDLYLLYQEGEFLKDSGIERRKKWDDEVTLFLVKHFRDICKRDYLWATQRRPEISLISSLDDSLYDNAVLYIKDLLEHDFTSYYKGEHSNE